MMSTDSTNGSTAVGLRERLRQTVRSELSRIAMQMFLERGFDATTIDEIAAAAGISRSTFFRHFAKKEDVILARLEARAETLRAAALARPACEPPLRVAREALAPLVDSFAEDRARSIALGRLVADTPSLRARELHKYLYWRSALAEVLAGRLGTDPDTDMRPSLIASVAVNAFDVALRTWRNTDSGVELGDLVDDAFATLAADFAAAFGGGGTPEKR
ncbi:TetR family transcriptional regulator [Frankia sp. Cppng1_Ct_nod]|uniref:acyl-CoA-like ligand-binding transcription factor n=1 Tax=Frankia sp. Cppng1_Ct_nod TaxID=2897162 RepID=UPI0013EF77B5|nr:TetR family transcriptional regulator [Frankia sp. Cppng1_Ct_nod]